MTTTKMQLFWLIYLFLMSSTCFGAMSSPIIRSTWFYLQHLILSTDIAAGWCHGWDLQLLILSTDIAAGWCHGWDLQLLILSTDIAAGWCHGWYATPCTSNKTDLLLCTSDVQMSVLQIRYLNISFKISGFRV